MTLLVAAPTATPKAESKPVSFKADNCQYGRAMSEAVCSGRVRVWRGDARLRCRKLTVRFDSSGQVSEMLCAGAVRFHRGDAEEATGKHAHYQRDGAQVTLKGDAKLRRGRARLAGERVIFLLDKDQVRVEGKASGKWRAEDP